MLSHVNGPGRVVAPVAVAYPRAVSDLDCTSLARDEASDACDDVHLAPCGKERGRRSPEEPPLPRPSDFSREDCLKAASVGHDLPSQLQRAVDEPGQEVARQPNKTKTGAAWETHTVSCEASGAQRWKWMGAEIRADHRLSLNIYGLLVGDFVCDRGALHLSHGWCC